MNGDSKPHRRADGADASLSAALPLLLEPARARQALGRDGHGDRAARARGGGRARRAARASLRRRADGAPGHRRDHRQMRRGRALLEPHHLRRRPRARVLPALADAGLDHVQLSLQGIDVASADKVAGLKGSHDTKMKFAAEVARLGLALTVNAVIHRGNIDQVEGFIELAQTLGARPARDRPHAILRLGLHQSRGADAGAARRRQVDPHRRGGAQAPLRHARHRPRRAGLLRAAPEGLRRRLGPQADERRAVRQGAALPRRRNRSRTSSSGT